MAKSTNLDIHHIPTGLSDKTAYAFTKFLRFFADTFFSGRYGHRAVVLETIAAVPGMVGGAYNIYAHCAVCKVITVGYANC